MDSLWEILLVITLVAVAGVAFAVAFLRDRIGGRSRRLPTRTDTPGSEGGAPDSRPSGSGAAGPGTSTIERKPPKKNTYQPRSGVTIDTGGPTQAKPSQTKPAPEPPAPTDRAGSSAPGSAERVDDDSRATGEARGDGLAAAPKPSSTPPATPIGGERPPAEVDDAPQADAPVDAIGTDETRADETRVDESQTVEVPDSPAGLDSLEPRETERPESARGRLTRLRSRLAGSNSALGQVLLRLLAGGKLDDEAWEEVEDTLLQADLGVAATTEVVQALRTRVAAAGQVDADQVRGWLSEELVAQVQPDLDRRIAASRLEGRPAVVLVVGVNGTGKTTTVGKLARVLVAEDKDVLLGAADTFRAAAADQLETWGARVGVPTVRSDKDGADPAAVAYDAVKAGIETEADVVLIDTAGRLHNKSNLMDELAKVKRVVEKLSPIDEVLLVLDATTGQNGMRQAEVFGQAVDVTGVVLTKLDGTAKGGIVVAVQRQLGAPVKLVGLGEGPDDLAPFDPVAYVDAVLD